MSIISIVDKNRSLSIVVDTNQSTNRKSIKVDYTIYCDYRLCSIMIDFDRFQSTSSGNTKNDVLRRHT